MKRLILASTSPYRRELLARYGLPFDVAAPRVDETRLPGEAPATMARRLARAKADAAAREFPGALIIGSDQVACAGNEVFDKPGTVERAQSQLREMRGREVAFHTALCVIDGETRRYLESLDTTRVGFRDYSDDEIARYLAREPDAIQCAGAAKAEALGASLLAYIRGDDPTALIGLPLIALATALREAGMALP